MMQMECYRKVPAFLVLAAATTFAAGVSELRSMPAAQSATQQAKSPAASAGQPAVATARVPEGRKVEIEGIILKRDPDSLTVRDTQGSNYIVKLANATAVVEKKSNPFRRARNYATTQLLRGLSVEVRGVGDKAGDLVAGVIRIRSADMRLASTVESRVEPVETRLAETESRLSQSEQNAQRLSGQLQEVETIANAARGGAKAAQTTAESATAMANSAGTAAKAANVGVEAANERISSLDNFEVKGSVKVQFKIGSAVLSQEAQTEIDKLAESLQRERGYLIEVSGFASAEGSDATNSRLSQRRADAVIRYMAENYSIPLRRFVTPFGYGSKQPVGDNKTRAGRSENRRVEIKILVNKGLMQSAGARAAE